MTTNKIHGATNAQIDSLLSKYSVMSNFKKYLP